MEWSDLGKRLVNLAPMIGTALGGPAGATIGAIVASTLGTNPTPEEVAKKLQGDPQAVLELKRLELKERDSIRSHVLELAKVDMATSQAEMQDQQQARTVHKDHWMPSALTIILAIMVVGVFLAILTQQVQENQKEVVFYLVGQVVTAFLTAVAFWLGSSRSSQQKDKLIGGAPK